MAKIILSFHTSLENHVPSLFFGFMDGYLVVAGISPDSEAGEICLYMAWPVLSPCLVLPESSASSSGEDVPLTI